jgi:hypothetical protein
MMRKLGVQFWYRRPWRAAATRVMEVLIPRVTRFELAGPVVRARSSFLNAIKELPLRAAEGDAPPPGGNT